MQQQFYYTHCTSQTSVFGEAEYGIRAASVPAQDIPRPFADEIASLAQYALPLDMRGGDRSRWPHDAGRAPVRLARLRTQDGRFAVVHSVYRNTDTLGRPHCFFAHILIPPAGQPPLSPVEVLELWGSKGQWGTTDGFVWSDDPTGQQLLPPWTGSPQEGTNRLIGIDSLRRFLLGESNPVPTDRPSLETTPLRLQVPSNHERRRELLESVLLCYLAGKRLYLVAEPGLAALLIYSLTQLLPPELTQDLTFSTFEASHRRYWDRNAHIVNTYWDPASKKELDLPPTVDRCAALNTFTFNRSGFDDMHETYRAFARYVLDRLETGKLADLKQLWEIWRKVAEKLDCSSLVKTWQVEQRIAAVDKTQLSPQEVDHFLGHPVWRPKLLAYAGGRRQAIETVFSSPERPPWWLVSPTDPSLQDFRPWLDELRRLAVDRIARAFFQQRDVEILDERFNRVLQPLLDQVYPLVRAFREVIMKVESSVGKKRLVESLAWNKRRWIIHNLCKLVSQDRNLEKHRAKWLSLGSANELGELCGDDNICLECKILAIKIWLETEAARDANVVRVLIHCEPLLRALPAHWGNSAGAGLALGTAIDRLFRAAPSNNERAEFFKRLASANWPRPDERSQVCASLLTHLIRSAPRAPVPWHVFFDAGGGLSGPIAEVLETLKPRIVADFWAACCDDLDGSCLLQNRPKNKVLRTLISESKKGSIPWQPDQARCSQMVWHWEQLWTMLCQPSLVEPKSPNWDLFRASLKSVNVARYETYILRALLQNIPLSDRHGKEQLVEIVKCAEVLSGFPEDPVAVARWLLGLSRDVEPSAGNDLQLRLIRLVCERNPAHYTRILDSLRPELPAAIVSELEKGRKELGQQLLADLFQKEVKSKRRIVTTLGWHLFIVVVSMAAAFLLGMFVGTGPSPIQTPASVNAPPAETGVQVQGSAKKGQPPKEPPPRLGTPPQRPASQPPSSPAQTKPVEPNEQKANQPELSDKKSEEPSAPAGERPAESSAGREAPKQTPTESSKSKPAQSGEKVPEGGPKPPTDQKPAPSDKKELPKQMTHPRPDGKPRSDCPWGGEAVLDVLICKPLLSEGSRKPVNASASSLGNPVDSRRVEGSVNKCLIGG